MLDKILKDIATHKRQQAFAQAEAGLSLSSNALHYVPPERHADGSIRQWRPKGYYSYPQGHCNHDRMYVLPCVSCHRTEAEAQANILKIYQL